MMKEGTETTLETLVNQIAHDVRNHAFTMGLQAEMGIRRAGNAPEIKAHFEAVLRQVDALKHYLEQLLLFGRPIRLTLTSVDLVALLREQVQRLQFGWDPNAPPFEVKVETEGQLRRGSWDPRALSHALLALLDNAVRSASSMSVPSGAPAVPAKWSTPTSKRSPRAATAGRSTNSVARPDRGTLLPPTTSSLVCMLGEESTRNKAPGLRSVGSTWTSSGSNKVQARNTAVASRGSSMSSARRRRSARVTFR